MKYKQQILSGIFSSVLVWLAFIMADLIDEYILGSGLFIGATNFTILPFVMLALYIKKYRQRKPETKSVMIWFTSYSLTYLILWYAIFYLENIDRFIVQKHNNEIIDINGIEYTLYGFSTLIFFIVLCALFHIYSLFGRKNNQNK